MRGSFVIEMYRKSRVKDRVEESSWERFEGEYPGWWVSLI